MKIIRSYSMANKAHDSFFYFHIFSEKYTRFCQWKNLELNIQVKF